MPSFIADFKIRLSNGNFGNGCIKLDSMSVMLTSTEANEVVKDVGKTDRKPAQQKQAVDGKDKKLSIHERLEINKRIIQEKQGKDKTERGVDLGVRTV